MKNKFLKKVGQFFCKNAGHIGTFAAILGVGATAYLAVKDTDKFKAVVKPEMTKKEKAAAVAKCYWRTGLAGSATVLSILGVDISYAKKLEQSLDAYTALKKTTKVILDENTALQETLQKENPEALEKVKADQLAARASNIPVPIEKFCFEWHREKVWFDSTYIDELNAEIAVNTYLNQHEKINIDEIAALLSGKSFPTNTLNEEYWGLMDGEEYGFNKNGAAYGCPDFVSFIHRDKIDKDGNKYIQVTLYRDGDYSYLGDDVYYESCREVPEKVDKSELPFK